MIRPGQLALLGVIAGLASALAAELGAFRPADTPPPPAPPPLSAAPTAVAPPNHVGQWVATILARPLFDPARRPPATESGPAIAGLPRLAGVLVGPFGRSAIFAADDGKPLVVEEGGHVRAWTVRRISADAVEITGPAGPRLLRPAFRTAPAERANTPATAGQRIGWSLPR